MISTEVANLIQDALERGLGQGEDIGYDVSMIAVPAPGGQPSPMLGLSFTIPSLDLSQGHSIMFLMPPTIPSQDDMDGLVRRVVIGLLGTRRQAAAAQSNGHKDLPDNISASGLILPS